MKLDLRKTGRMPVEVLREFEAVAVELRPLYSEFISDLGDAVDGGLLWWLSPPASRHSYLSPLFSHLCGLVLVDRLCSSGQIPSEIISDSKAFCDILEKQLAKGGYHSTVLYSADSKLKAVARSIFTALKGITTACVTHIKISKAVGRGESVSENPITLISTYALPGYVENDRYFGVVDGFLDDLEVESVYFLPRVTGFASKELSSVVQRLCNCRRNVLFREQFLQLSDYVWAFMQQVRMAFLRVEQAMFKGVDVSPLVNEEFIQRSSNPSILMAFLEFRFAMRLKDSGVVCRSVLSWWENYCIDKGGSLGFSRYYPQATHIGYLGFPSYPMHLCLYPTQAEKDAGVLPDEIAVIGKEQVLGTKEFCQEINVRVGPALRFEHIYEPCRTADSSDVFTVLLPLPIKKSDGLWMIRFISLILAELPDDVLFLIKPHPTTPLGDNSLLRELRSERVKEVEGDFMELLETANMLVGMGSSVSLEALAREVPTALVVSPAGLMYNPIPQSVSKKVWRLCYDAEELVAAIVEFRNSLRNNDMAMTDEAAKIRAGFFSLVDRKSVLDLVGLQAGHLDKEAS
ncbi:MAG: hypothetical protein OCC46_10065 [Pseudodesulfovibrio sp.]